MKKRWKMTLFCLWALAVMGFTDSHQALAAPVTHSKEARRKTLQFSEPFCFERRVTVAKAKRRVVHNKNKRAKLNQQPACKIKLDCKVQQSTQTPRAAHSKEKRRQAQRLQARVLRCR